MKLRYRIIWLICIWAITFPLGWIVYPYYWKWDFAISLGYANWERWTTLARHPLGYGILGYFFGWIVLVLAVIDEPVQFLIKKEKFSLFQMVLNIIGALAGMGISKFIKITVINPWRK